MRRALGYVRLAVAVVLTGASAPAPISPCASQPAYRQKDGYVRRE
jgi:hypothetical protein